MLIPEKHSSRAQVKQAISSQFWEQSQHSTRSIDGQVWTLPCEPPALSLTGSSGLSRTQQLIAAQAIGAPVLPSYDGKSQGLVLDRVLAKVGGRRWWMALGGRIKAQRILNLASDGNTTKLAAFKDLESYSLCSKARFQLGRRLTLNGVVEAPNVQRVNERIQQRRQARQAPDLVPSSSPSSSTPPAAAAAEAAPSLGPAVWSPEEAPCRAHANLRFALPGHDLNATLGYNQEYVDSSGDCAHVPLAVSLDLSSKDHGDGLQYRVGLHQVSAPITEGASRRPVQLRTALHLQGAVAVEGEAYVWKGSSATSPSDTKAGAAATQPAPEPATAAAAAPAKAHVAGGTGPQPIQQQQQQQQQQQEQQAAARPGRLASALDAAQAADEDEESSNGEGPSVTTSSSTAVSTVEPVSQSAVKPAGPSAIDSAAAAGSSERAQREASNSGVPAFGVEGASSQPHGPLQDSLENFIRPLEKASERLSDMIHHMQHPEGGDKQLEPGASNGREGQQAASSTSSSGGPGGSSSSSSSSLSGPQRLLGLSAEAVGAGIQESMALLQQLKQSVSRLTGDVQDGSLQRLSRQLADSRQAPQRRRPYSVLLAQPHLKLNASMGCLARAPLPSLRAVSLPHSLSGPLGSAAMQRNSSLSSLASRNSVSSQLVETLEPYLKDTSLRVFAAGSISGQLGRFTRPFLDYTAASLRVDIGLTSPHTVGMVPEPAALTADEGHRPDKHRAFALEGQGAWHALSASFAQQVVGPVRARVDMRFALDPTNMPQDKGERSTMKGLVQTALSVRPSLLETVCGFDCVLPGTEGAARLAVWWSPKRREAMAELRLF